MNVSAVHPGELLQRELAARKLSASRFAVLINLPVCRIHDILYKNCAITPDMALRIGCYFGHDPLFWMFAQAAYDLRSVQKADGHRIVQEVTRAEKPCLRH